MIELTDTAAREVQRIIKDNSLEGVVLRMGVRGGGCSGLSYTLGFDKEISQYDRLFEFEGIKVAVDMKSYLYLKGTQVDYAFTPMGELGNVQRVSISAGF